MCALCALGFLLACISHEEVECKGGVISRPLRQAPTASRGRQGRLCGTGHEVREMAQMCALCALGFLPEEFFESGDLFFGRLGGLVIGGGPECGVGTAAGNVSIGG